MDRRMWVLGGQAGEKRKETGSLRESHPQGAARLSEKKTWEPESYKCATLIFEQETMEIFNHSSQSHQVTRDISSHLVKLPSISKDETFHHLIRVWMALSDAKEMLGAF